MKNINLQKKNCEMVNKNLQDLRDAFFDQIFYLAQNDKNVVIVTNDMDIFSLRKFKEKFPDRFYNMGVAEQNMINFACGLASEGRKVIVYGILPFLVYRCLEQIKFNLCSMNLPVAIVGVGTGYSFSYDGPTHHATHDIAVLNSLPEINIYNPSTPKNAKLLAKEISMSKKPCFVRLDKGVFSNAGTYYNSFAGFDVLHEISSINVISTGSILKKIENIVQDINKNATKVGLIDIYRIKPFPKSIINLLSKSKKLYVVEENYSGSGLGSIIAHYFAIFNIKIEITFFSINDIQSFKYGSRDWLLLQEGLSLSKLKKRLTDD